MKPPEPGLYWARPDKYRWWPILIEIVGEVPFLRPEVRMNRTGKDVDPDDLIYSDAIELPEVID